MRHLRAALWKRLDQDGHDACCFIETRDRRSVQGCAVFEDKRKAAHLAYRLVCDDQWRSLEASVTGWVGINKIELLIKRDGAGAWSVNGSARHDLTGLQDIDLGFTPASNTNAIRRLDLDEGYEAAATAVWLDTEDWAVKSLPQIYHRLAKNAYHYSSPLHDFRATLRVDDYGAVTEYPSLWVMLRQ